MHSTLYVGPDTYVSNLRAAAEVPMRAVEITTENANALRESFRQSIETYSAFENVQKIIKSRSTEIAGPMRSGEVAALCKGSDRIEVVTHAEYLNDANKIRWY
jgi:hypothetical protein